MNVSMLGEVKAKMALWKMKTKKFIGITKENTSISPKRDLHRNMSKEDLGKHVLQKDSQNSKK